MVRSVDMDCLSGEQSARSVSWFGVLGMLGLGLCALLVAPIQLGAWQEEIEVATSAYQEEGAGADQTGETSAVPVDGSVAPVAGDEAGAGEPAGEEGSELVDAEEAVEAEEEPGVDASPDTEPRRLYDRDPYDLVILDAANDHHVLKVMPLPFPERRQPERSERIGRLTVRLFEEPGEEYEISWRNIDRIELFEELVLREAEEIALRAGQQGRAGDAMAAQQGFDEAYDYFQWLLTFHPNVAGLERALRDYLYLNSASLFAAGLRYASEAGGAAAEAPVQQQAYQGFAQAFAILEGLYEQDPEYTYGSTTTVTAAMERVGDRLIRWYVERSDFVSARRLLARLSRQYAERLELILTWRQRLMRDAAALRDTAAEHLEAERFVEAHDASREMLRIWPQIEGGRDLVLEIARRYPLIVVGVSQPSLEPDPTSMDNFAAWRAGQLVYPTLLEYRERGPEGGRYASRFGEVRQSDDRTRLIFDLRPEPGQPMFSGYDLSSNLLALADPNHPRYEPSWASLMRGVRVERVLRVEVSLRRPHVLPQSFLRVPFRFGETMAQRYQRDPTSNGDTRFQPLGARDNPGEPRPVIVERFLDQPRAAVEALRRGQIDMIDRLLPADAQRLRQEPELAVGAYAFPTLFVVVPNQEHPYLANRTFRRALVYAINREVILQRGLLNGQRVAGSRVISAPLPAGVDANDLSAYAYDEQIDPYPYDPVMSAILMALAGQQLAALADQREEPAPELGELVLCHPHGELGRFIANQIQQQLAVVDVPVQLRELGPGHSVSADDAWHLQLREIRMQEPVVDLPRLLGQNGVFPASDPYVGLALRQLAEAENWRTARQSLHELHRQLHNDVTVIPLWQLTEHFAYHRGVRGVSERPITFYQNLENWRIIPPEYQD